MSECNNPVDLEAGSPKPEPNAWFDLGKHSVPHSRTSSSSTASSVAFLVPRELFLKPAPKDKSGRPVKKRYRLRRRYSFCRVLSWIIGFLLLISFVVAILFIIYRPEVPSYSIDSISVKNLNFLDLIYASPEFDISVRAENTNKKIGIFYENGSDVSISYSGEHLVSGAFPVFYQGPRNVTSFLLVLTGSNVRLSSAARQALIQGQQDGGVPLLVSLNVPLRLKIGSVRSLKFTVKVRCDVTVDKLVANTKTVTKKCKYTMDA